MIEANRVSKVVFEKLNESWVAMIFVLNTDVWQAGDPELELCVAWHPVGSKAAVNTICHKQLDPQGIPWEVKHPGEEE